MATALVGRWDTEADGPPPDAWVPESSAWVRKASVDADAERMIPDLQPSLARTPDGDRDAQAAGRGGRHDRRKLTWQQIITSSTRPTAGSVQAPGVGRLQGRPVRPAGVHRRAARPDGDLGHRRQRRGEPRRAGRPCSTSRGSSRSRPPSTDEIFAGLQVGRDQDAVSALTLRLRVPGARAGRARLQPGPAEGAAGRDLPAGRHGRGGLPVPRSSTRPGATRRTSDVANAFLRYVRGPDGKAAFQAAGFRDANRGPGPDLVAGQRRRPRRSPRCPGPSCCPSRCSTPPPPGPPSPARPTCCSSSTRPARWAARCPAPARPGST